MILGVLLWTGPVSADDAPISGTVKSVDDAGQTLTIETTANGKTRQVTIHLKPGAKIVRFARATEPGQTGFVEQPVALADLKPGWTVSALTEHEGDKEVSRYIRVVLDR
jgi:hypothetical protein